MRAHILADSGAYSVFPRGSMTEPNMVSRILPGPYRFSHYAFTAELAITNKPSLAHYRAVGHPVAIFATERLMDIAAAKLRLDPVEIRRRNLVRPQEMPYTSAVGATYSAGAYEEALDRLLEAVDYEALRRWQGAERARGRLVGIGIATFIEGTAPGAQFYAALGAPIMAARRGDGAHGAQWRRRRAGRHGGAGARSQDDGGPGDRRRPGAPSR